MDRELDQWRAELEWLRALAIRLVRDPERADELAQETALISLRRSSELDPGERPWRAGVLKKLITNRARDHARRRRRESHATPPAAPPAPGDLVEQLEVHHQITEAILALDEPHRAVVILRYFHARTSAEIARETGEPEATVRSRLQRALARLRSDLDRRFGGDRRKWAAPLVAWLALSAGGEGAQGAELAGSSGSAAGGSASPAPLPFGGVLVSANKAATVVTSAVLLATAIGWLVTRDDSREGLSDSGTEPVAVVEAPSPPSSTDLVPPVLLPAPGTTVILGDVRNRHSDRPIAGARVVIRAVESQHEIARCTTDADGAYAVEFLNSPAGKGAEMHISAGDHIPARLSLAGDATGWPTSLSTIYLAIGVEVSGLVVDSDGLPVPGAEVSAWAGVAARVLDGAYLSEEARIVTPWESCDAEGRFRVTLPRGEATIVARTDDASGRATLLVGDQGDEQILVTVREDAPILGCVVDASGEPVQGAAITAWRQMHVAGERLPTGERTALSTLTDVEGAFRIPSLGYTHDLLVTHPDHVPWRGDRGGGRDDTFWPGRPRTVVLSRGRTIRGSLRLPHGSQVDMRSVELALDIGDSVRGELGEDGSFSLTEVPRASGGGTLEVGGALPRELRWLVGDADIDVGEVTVVDGATLAVEVSDPDGRPLSGIGVRASAAVSGRLTASQPITRTDADGRALIRGCAPGETEIVAWGNGFGRITRTVVIPAEGMSTSIRIEPDAELRGRWLDSSGEPQPGVALRILGESTVQGGRLPSHEEFPDSPADLFEDSTGADGAFRFPSLPCGVPLTLEIAGAGWFPSSLRIDPLVPGERRDLGDLLGTDGSTLRVAVTELSGEPIPWAHVELITAPGEVTRRFVQRADTAGRIPFRGLAPGSYLLHVRAKDRVSREVPVEVRAAEESISVALDPGETWELQVLDPDGAPIENASVNLWTGGSYPASSARSSADGIATLTAVPGRPRHFRVSADDHFDAEAEDITGNLPREVVLERAATLEVRFEVPDWGPPVLGGTVKVLSGRSTHHHRVFPGSDICRVDGLVEGTVPVEIAIEGYVRFETSVDLRAGQVTPLVFRPTALAETVNVVVIDARGTPVLDAEVRFAPRRDGPLPEIGGAVTLRPVGDGRYTGSLPERGPLYDIVATAPGYGPTLVEGIAFDREERITIGEGAGIDLVVLEADGTPASAREISVTLHSEHRLLRSVGQLPRTVTDTRGKVELRGLAAARYRIEVLRDRAPIAGEYRDLAVGEIAAMEIRLATRLEIRGCFSSGGRPVEGEELEIRTGTETLTTHLDGQGRFVASIPHSERIHVTVGLPKGHRVTFGDVEVVPGTPIVLSHDPVGGELRFVGPDGRPFGPLAGGVHPVVGSPVGGTFRFEADAEGIASIPELPVGWHKVGANLAEGWALLDEEIEAGPSRWTLRVGRTGTLRVRLVHDPDAHDGIEYVDEYRCDSSGRYWSLPWPTTFHREEDEMRMPVPLGDAGRTVVLCCPGRAPLVLDLAAGLPDDAVRIPDLPGGSLRIVLPEKGSTGLHELRIEALDGPALPEPLSRRVWRGSPLVHALPSGRYRISVAGPLGVHEPEPIEISTGKTTTVRL